MSASTVELSALLNPPQLEAVTAADGPLLIFAGAGSGKTRVLTYRIAHLVESGRARPDDILAVTFTNKAAREMRGRIEELVGVGQAPPWMGTFHSICGRILRRDGNAIGVDRSFVVYDQADRLAVVKRAMQKLGLDEKKFPPNAVSAKISSAKNEMQGPAEFSRAANDYFAEVVSRVYPVYEAAMRDAGALDF
ncbi:MAG: ATP-dependent helicase, partial [Candidatus Dormibacteria bacterium]